MAQVTLLYPTYAILDQNYNGLSDVWELQHNNGALFPPNFNLSDDPDGDGWNNLTESIAGTNPHDASEPKGIIKPRIEGDPADGIVRVNHPAVIGKNYQLQGSTDLMTWLNVNDAVLARQNEISSMSGVATTAGELSQTYFWRLNITDADSDTDGLTDAEEIIFQTNPNYQDTDNDGIIDKNEILRSLDPLNSDTDNDGNSDGQEDSLQTNPANPDTDGDTINDGDEIANGTAPLRIDTDDDGLSDLQEKNLGTNPLLADSDGDGIPDGLETTNGTNPLALDSDGDGIFDNADSAALVNAAISDPDGANLPEYLNNSVSETNGVKLIGRYDFESLPNGASSGFPSSIAGIPGASAANVGWDIFQNPSGMPSYTCRWNSNPTINEYLSMPHQIVNNRTKHAWSYWLKLPKNAFVPSAQNSGIRTLLSIGINQFAPSNPGSSSPLPALHWFCDIASGTIRAESYQIQIGTAAMLGSGWNIPPGWNDGEWHHIVFSKNDTKYNIYFDGVALGERTSNNINLPLTSSSYTLIGRRDLTFTTLTNASFRFPAGSRLDRLRCYTRLSLTDVLALYNQDIDRDGLFDRTEARYNIWRDSNQNALREAEETSYILRPFHFDAATSDHDNDGVSSLTEQNTTHTDPAKTDTDGDLMPDGWETAHGLNPLSAGDANLDSDGDGLTNINEYRYNTDPIKSDSDGDGKSDGQEAKGTDGNLDTDDGSNPNDASDGGTRASADTLLTLTLGVGDRSGSHSEDYVLHVYQLQADGSEKRVYTLRSGGFGQYKEETRSFPKTHSYTFQIDWQGTNNNVQNPGTSYAEGADFDYHLVINPISGHAGHILIDSYDPKSKTADPNSPLRDPQDINPSDDNNDDVASFVETHEPKRVVLLRAGFLVDANRDGQFSAEDEGKITEQTPWRIWINDDNDWHETGGNDIPNGDSNNRDVNNHYIDQERDLVDFFPMTLKLEDILKLFPKNTHAYTIAHDGIAALHPAVRVVWIPESDLTRSYGACDKHLKDIDYARSIKNSTSYQVFNSGYGRHIPDVMLSAFEEGKGLLLVEGNLQTDKPLRLKIRRKSNNAIVATTELPLRVDHVESMYRTVNLMYATTEYDGTPRNRDSEGVTTKISDPSALPDAETNGKYFVFLHGFNVSPMKSRGWNAEVFKRLHQLGGKARFVGVTWDSDELFPNYHRAVFQAFQTGDVLAGALSFTNNADVTVAAHSLGNMVVSHAIQDGGFLPTRYYSINAAVPREAYSLTGIDNAEKRSMVEGSWKDYWDYNPNNATEPTLKHLFAAYWHELFPADDARCKLTWRNKFSSVRSRMYNFYSAGDDVVRNPRENFDTAGVLATALSGTGFSSYSWAAQEYVKGGTSAAKFAMYPPKLIQAGWGYNYWPPYSGYYQTVLNDPPTDEVYYRKYNPQEAAQYIVPDTMRSTPFFKKFNESELHHADTGTASTGSVKAAQLNVIYDIFARGIPSMSYAAATHSIEGAKENFDMQGTLRTDVNRWPTEGRTDEVKMGSWLHSDMRDMALLHVYQIYQKFIINGDLNQ